MDALHSRQLHQLSSSACPQWQAEVGRVSCTTLVDLEVKPTMLTGLAAGRSWLICAKAIFAPLQCQRGQMKNNNHVVYSWQSPPPRRLEGHPSGRQGTCTSTAGRKPFRSTRYLYLVDWKDTLPVDEVQVPCRLEGSPSGQRGTSASSTGRTPFQSSRYLYLDGWKEALPAGPLEGGYPRIPARIPASGCGCGCGCTDGRKKQPDIRMPIDHL
ncbi:uncharacterized protein PGTG_21888 [Puccinia graminis f. sp. tritici CRL 75-36-700-3]|uniref:Uncharacterized protein n=1 Tax=Puccinia graminis f. sp. tritici (strain CRL 75-36-700-3 / race SCCL) TaxID=418459 RepID=H6QSW0_PUCGT|nr:uncharacterized protein PGTG_21888 [Puccinia graminis f. sp. tritici CRL 75-36-700-3]EHS63849.1 hypothetical protein PGTG_21888 [Puccinia graminis f. sp. tritici CRL 75-36-700-3]